MDKFHTCISVDKDLWKKFCVKVLTKHGNFRNSMVIEDLIKEYLKQK